MSHFIRPRLGVPVAPREVFCKLMTPLGQLCPGRRVLSILFLSWGLLHAISMAHGGSPTKQKPWHYTLLTGSELIDDCPVCGRPTFSFPLRGSFGLQLLEENPLFAT